MLDPISLTLTAAGLAASVYGTITQTSAARSQARSQQAVTGLEMQVEAQRRKAMELDARRRSLEIVRQQQRARSMALTTATAQGAAQGSVLGGAYGQIQGQSNFNLAGINQNLALGRNIFDLNAQISQQRIGMAQTASNAATGAGISSLGGALVANAGTISNLANTGQSLYENRSSTFGINPLAGAFSFGRP